MNNHQLKKEEYLDNKIKKQRNNFAFFIFKMVSMKEFFILLDRYLKKRYNIQEYKE